MPLGNPGHRRLQAVQDALAGRAFLQVGQTALAYQTFLGNLAECCPHPDMDRHRHLHTRRHPDQRVASEEKHVRRSTVFERVGF